MAKCAHCEVQILSHRGWWAFEHYNAKYCSEACKQAAYRQRKKVINVKNCDHCQSEHIRKGKFCSDACKQAAYRLRVGN